MEVISNPQKSAQVEDTSEHSPGNSGDIISTEQKKVIRVEERQNFLIYCLRMAVGCLLLQWLGHDGSCQRASNMCRGNTTIKSKLLGK